MERGEMIWNENLCCGCDRCIAACPNLSSPKTKEYSPEEIMALLSAVRTDFGGFANLLSRTQKRLRQASETIETAQRHSETIARRLTGVGELPQAQARELLGEEGTADPFDDEDDGWD